MNYLLQFDWQMVEIEKWSEERYFKIPGKKKWTLKANEKQLQKQIDFWLLDAKREV